MYSIDSDTLERLHESVGSASWALWSEEFPAEGCIEDDPEAFYEFVTARQTELSPAVVLLSLNPSGEFPEGLLNFHSTDSKHYDTRLKEFIQDAGLEQIHGAYMTDIVLDEVESDGNSVEATEHDVQRFLEQLRLFEQPEYDVICFHAKPFEALRDYFETEESDYPYNIRFFETDWGERTIRGYRVWFYGNWGANQDKVTELRKQLVYLNGELHGFRG